MNSDNRFRWLRYIGIILFLLCIGLLLRNLLTQKSTQIAKVKAVQGDIVKKASAVGRIEVRHEIPINSTEGGILTKIFVRLGQQVKAGEPLAEVRPLATENALLAAERNLQAAKRGEESAREYLQLEHAGSLISELFLGQKNAKRMYDGAVEARKQAEERLQLLKQGTAMVNDRVVDFIVRAPVDGHVLEIKLREGAPVVPSSSYGQGTVFMTLADMTQLLFRGTANEMDAGKLHEGMKANIKVGALLDTFLTGKVTELGLKGQERNNAMVFDVIIQLTIPPQLTLRSGYSAVADIEIGRCDQVLILPERVIEFSGEKTFVMVLDQQGKSNRRQIETGLSDGLMIEVKKGLSLGDEVLERQNP